MKLEKIRLTSRKKKKHISTFFYSEPKKFKFYYKFRHCYYLYNKKNIYINDCFSFGLILLESLYLYIEHILSCIKLIKFFFKTFLLDNSVLVILIFPDFFLTSKPREVRMGRGKGKPSKKIVIIKKNTIIFKLLNISKFYALYILKQCQYRLPCKTKILFKIW